MPDSRESKRYAALGASTSKDGVHKALVASGTSSKGPTFFAEVQNDCCGDPSYYSMLHADGAGTKAIVAYLAYRETKDPRYFRSLAQDSLVMNLDDVICVGAFESLVLSNTLGRNRTVIPDEAVQEIISGYREQIQLLAEHGIEIQMAGGETADLGDLVRTLVVDSTLFARVKRAEAISTDAIAAGDIIIGLSSTGQSRHEPRENSGIGSNGITLARHAVLPRRYAEKYPEILDPRIDPAVAYAGSHELFTTPSPLSMNVAEALLSPTRSYAPVIRSVLKEVGREVHGIVHCSGGGQSKALRFGKSVRYVKDNLFPIPPIFQLIQQSGQIPWSEMYTVFNMGHRMELMLPPQYEKTIIDIASSFGIEAKRIGHIEKSAGANEVKLTSAVGNFNYSL